MIVTLTVNPALDRTIDLDTALVPGAVHRASSSREDAAGKGVNVARVLHTSGAETCAVLPLASDDPYAALLDGAGTIRAVSASAHARVNITLTDGAGETTKINLAGGRPDEAVLTALVDAAVEAADGASWLAICGSLPTGVPADFYARVVRAVRERAARPPRIAVDASGAALVAVLAAGPEIGPVDLIKPNEDELVEALVDLDPSRDGAELLRGISADPAGETARLARELVPHRVRAALVTLGGDGAVLITGEGAWQAGIPAGVRVRSTVGAGDSSLAGFLLAATAQAAAGECLRSAVRYGSATASLPGTALAAPADLPTGDIPVRALA
ncbi:1-phosphofructokinase family hexose kinase [Microbacterium oryzae]|uniref:1-phosphofructokinase family hexose kinase n=1 Tax=Microbacterium oryzae TaxID=743009 RepID=UPI0025B082F4|nr:1-phosphofructokinase family hexose kinase [Microbacterium oryzae]MDN3311191.1 1-phosphofructokinase family hexose kinase [Microbacterium oryzae]